MALPEEVTSYLDELAADIAQNGGLEGVSIEEAVAAAHARRQAFASEMHTGSTLRSKMARKVLNTSVWNSIQRQIAEQRLRAQQTDSTTRLFLDCEALNENSDYPR